MILFSHTITSRLQYIAEFIRKETGISGLTLTTHKDEFRNSGDLKINYSNEILSPDEFRIQPHGLLFERDIKQQAIRCSAINGYRAFFQTGGDFPFDIFAASFYLLSRYEEYLPHSKDPYGRYAHENSLAFRENFLDQPLVNIWILHFKEKLKLKFPSYSFQKSLFSFLPTYDIDEAFCYRNKPWWKTWGGYCRSLLKGNFWEIKERKNVLNGIQDDPYDSHSLIKDLHKIYQHLDAVIFFLVAEKNGKYDKNISPYNKEWKERIIRFFDNEAGGSNRSGALLQAGLHPSWQSGDRPELIKKELDLLEYEIGVEVSGSRQHYIRFNVPQTYRQLIEAGIYSDYSMGYGSINGFRASVASSFYWYDLEKEEKTLLELFPFCYMEANSFFEQKFSAQQALEEMIQYFNRIESVNGMMITIWHNTFLGSHRRFAGWRAAYEEFLQKIYFRLPSVNDAIDKEGMDRQYFLH